MGQYLIHAISPAISILVAVGYDKDTVSYNTQGFRMIVKSMPIEHGHYVCVLIPRLIVQALLTTAILCLSKKGVNFCQEISLGVESHIYTIKLILLYTFGMTSIL